MYRVSSLCPFAGLALFLTLLVQQAVADPPDILRNYRFIPSESTVHVTGGLPDYNLNLTIAGQFGLVTGYNELPSPVGSAATPPTLEPFAQFIDVHGILYNSLSATAAPRLVGTWIKH